MQCHSAIVHHSPPPPLDHCHCTIHSYPPSPPLWHCVHLFDFHLECVPLCFKGLRCPCTTSSAPLHALDGLETVQRHVLLSGWVLVQPNHLHKGEGLNCVANHKHPCHAVHLSSSPLGALSTHAGSCKVCSRAERCPVSTVCGMPNWTRPSDYIHCSGES